MVGCCPFGISFVPNLNRTWVPVGETPVLRETPGRHNHTGTEVPNRQGGNQDENQYSQSAVIQAAETTGGEFAFCHWNVTSKTGPTSVENSVA